MSLLGLFTTLFLASNFSVAAVELYIYLSFCLVILEPSVFD